MKTRITLFLLIVILIIACTIGVSHKVIINQYGDKDSTKNNTIIVNYNDSTKFKK